MHGYTHQFGNLINPYNGVSAEDFEFYTAHVDATNTVRYDGPVPGDSEAWVSNRIALSEAAFLAAGLQVPTSRVAAMIIRQVFMENLSFGLCDADDGSFASAVTRVAGTSP